MDQNILDFNYLIESILPISKGIPTALAIACISFLFGFIIAVTVALVRIQRLPLLAQLAAFYVSMIRGTPLLVQIFLIYYGIPMLFRLFDAVHYISDIPAIYFAYVAFSLNVGAYLSETVRSAIENVPKGQLEAAYSIGMTSKQAFIHIIFPQALVLALPNLGNYFIILLKETSLAFIISVPEIMGEAKMIAARTSQFFEAYIVAALLYWSICLVIEQILRYIEKRITLFR